MMTEVIMLTYRLTYRNNLNIKDEFKYHRLMCGINQGSGTHAFGNYFLTVSCLFGNMFTLWKVIEKIILK